MPKAAETVLEVDLDALAHNYRYIRSKIGKATKLMAVVKAFAYGSDAVAVAKTLIPLGLDYLAVAYAKEGIALRNAGIRIPILVLHPQELSLADILDYRLEPGLYSKKLLMAFLALTKEKGVQQYPVHLNFNTGLNRLGFNADDLPWLKNKLSEQAHLKIKGLFSHLAASEDKNERPFSLGQIRQFEALAGTLGAQLPERPLWHLLNTSGILNFPESQYDMVRSGIGLYGYGNHPDIDRGLRAVAQLKTIIAQVHPLAAGESVGYNRGFTSDIPRRIATLPLGHADGIGRHFGHGQAHVYINGKEAPIVGNVCMDMIMVDVTDIPCEEGDEVVLFGPRHSAATMAENAKTISYELLTAISQRVTRQYIPFGP